MAQINGASVILSCLEHVPQNVTSVKNILRQRSDKPKSSIPVCTVPRSEADSKCQIRELKKAAWCGQTDTPLSPM